MKVLKDGPEILLKVLLTRYVQIRNKHNVLNSIKVRKHFIQLLIIRSKGRSHLLSIPDINFKFSNTHCFTCRSIQSKISKSTVKLNGTGKETNPVVKRRFTPNRFTYKKNSTLM